MDHELFRKFANKYKQDIFLMIRTRVNSNRDAEDIMQNVLLKLYQGLDKFRGDSHVKTWIYRIVSNSISDYYRQPWWQIFGKIKHIPDEALPEGDFSDRAGSDTENPEKTLLKKEMKEQLFSQVKKMSRLERETFLLRFIDGFSIKEIASQLEMNVNTVKTHLYRAVKKAKAHLHTAT